MVNSAKIELNQLGVTPNWVVSITFADRAKDFVIKAKNLFPDNINTCIDVLTKLGFATF